MGISQFYFFSFQNEARKTSCKAELIQNIKINVLNDL